MLGRTNRPGPTGHIVVVVDLLALPRILGAIIVARANPGRRVIRERVEVIEPRQALIVLANEPLGDGDGAGRVASGAMRAEELVALSRSPTCRPADLRENAAHICWGNCWTYHSFACTT